MRGIGVVCWNKAHTDLGLTLHRTINGRFAVDFLDNTRSDKGSHYYSNTPDLARRFPLSQQWATEAAACVALLRLSGPQERPNQDRLPGGGRFACCARNLEWAGEPSAVL